MPVKTKNFDKGDFVYYVYNEETGKYEPVGKIDDIGEYDGEE